MFETGIDDLFDAEHLRSQNIFHVIDMTIGFSEVLVHASREVVQAPMKSFRRWLSIGMPANTANLSEAPL